MTNDTISESYFRWLCTLVPEPNHSISTSHEKLLRFLHSVDFYYIIPMDGNREADGVDLRYRFGYENCLRDAEITNYIDNKPCSVLEMMIALAIRCEENIMDDPDIGNRTAQWFWGMILNLGLYDMTDANYDEEYAAKVIERFLDRGYKSNGEGGLFTVHDSTRDMRNSEIWCQMCLYLGELSEVS